MSLRAWSKDRSTRKVTPPSASYMSNDQFADYLSNLRNNRVARPTPIGARPQPTSKPTRRSTLNDTTTIIQDDDDSRSNKTVVATNDSHPPLTHRRNNSALSDTSAVTNRGRPMVRQPYQLSKGDRDTSAGVIPTDILKPSEVVPSRIYIERGQRWMEKEDVHAISDALQDMDLSAQEKADLKLHTAAAKEASELVYQHQHPDRLPHPDKAYKYREYMKKNSYATRRTASTNKRHSDVSARTYQPRRSTSSSSDNANEPITTSSDTNSKTIMSDLHEPIEARKDGKGKSYQALTGSTYSRPHRKGQRNISGELNTIFSPEQIYQDPILECDTVDTNDTEADLNMPASLQACHDLRQNPVKPSDDGEVMDGEERSRTPIERVEIQRNQPSQSRNPAYTANPPLVVTEAVRAQTPTKDGLEIRSPDIRSATSKSTKDRSPNLPTPEVVSSKPGRLIVSFDKSWKPKGNDREDSSADRVTASMSDMSSSSIVARPLLKGPRRQLFGQGRFAAKEETQSLPVIPTTKTFQSSPLSPTEMPTIPIIQVEASEISDNGFPQHNYNKVCQDTSSKPPIPSIIMPDDTFHHSSIPMIVLPDDSYDDSSAPVPTISINDDQPQSIASTVPCIPTIAISVPDISIDSPTTHRRNPFARPLPNVTSPSTASNVIPSRQRPLPVPRATAPVPFNKGHWTVSPLRAIATCHECSLPIQGKVVSVHGYSERFHPTCLQCFTCSTPLEALEILPEPDERRQARLLRISRRAQGEDLEEKEGETDMEDGDPRLRFFCHLDWHELYAPRCKHCKTPIIGEHAVALGAHWHYGHFFCAECGDPFEQDMTHIEIDGYAWCVGCSSKRTERRAPKCRGCRKGVVGQYVEAIGSEWHETCFRCCDCDGGFEDGQFFVRDNGDVSCLTCMQRIWKA